MNRQHTTHTADVTLNKRAVVLVSLFNLLLVGLVVLFITNGSGLLN